MSKIENVEKSFEEQPKIYWPYSNLIKETSKTTNNITNFKNPVFIEVNWEQIEISKIKKLFLDFILEAYKIKEAYSKKLNSWKEEIIQKWNEKDVVTEADRKIEELFRKKFKSILPNYSIAWEEWWIDLKNIEKIVMIDPIDGTSWFIKWEPKYGTIIWMYRNWYNILSIVTNTKEKRVYYADLEWVTTYRIDDSWENSSLKEEKEFKNIWLENNIYLHFNFKKEDWTKDKELNNQIKEDLEKRLEKFNEENNTNYEIVFMQTAPDIWPKIARNEVAGFIHYWAAPHDIAGNMVYSIHNKKLNFTNHIWEKYNYFNSKNLTDSYQKYFKNIDTDWKKYLYKFPFIMTHDYNLQEFLLDFLKDYKDLFDLKANPS